MEKWIDTENYINSFPDEIQTILNQMRGIIKRAAPQAKEAISYGMPAFETNALLVWFAGNTNHIGFYPRASAIIAFKEPLSKYKTSKGAVQFLYAEPLPVGLITEMVKFRVKENLNKHKK